MTRMRIGAGTWAALAAAMIFSGCEATPPTAASVEAPSYAISDGAHGGLAHFFFLPPLVPSPAFTGQFDATLEPTVEICVLEGPECGVLIVSYSTTSGVSVGNEHYSVQWDTNEFELSPEAIYRIRVLVGGSLLGFADAVVDNGGGSQADESELVRLGGGRTLPIRFRIEEGAVLPVALPDAYSTDMNVPLAVAAPGVLANDADPDGDPLTAAAVGGPTNGTLTLNEDGSFLYVPNAGFTGTDGFEYVASDGALESNAATVTIAVNAVGAPPVANADAYSTDRDVPLVAAAPGVLANDTDPDGDPLTATAVGGPTNGALTFNGDGSFVYVPNAGFVGTDGFEYVATDGMFDSDVATVTIAVNAVGAPPVAAPDAYSIMAGMPLVVSVPGVLANDTDPDGDPLTAAVVGNPPANGALIFNADGSFFYFPNAGFVGTDGFEYRANDGTFDSNVARVAITVTGIALPAAGL